MGKDTQIVTISPTGGVSGLERKGMLDLKQFGKARVERVSQIAWQEEPRRGWFIQFIKGHRAGKIATNVDLFVATFEGGALSDHKIKGWLNKPEPLSHDNPEWGDAGLFENYDDAVAIEVAILDQDRLQGRY